ncbi:type II secretion system F family protein [Actinocrinis puniceicyclus]|uniref:Type II secretion system F family protein n=1 Tax=Actinocrinis puniceicyclus TaxID=977794 RepID=A0A8J7WI93_9ACTN|nr:type II secretion system F family protein [Actinocrinis puniceicyclus]MBS2962776.1 type II secretion system F family protein [Actinocrinis puniceicyclus]
MHESGPSSRPVELGVAAAFIIAAMVLRWAPPPSHRVGGLKEAAAASARWVSNARRVPHRHLLAAAFTGCAVGLFLGGVGGVVGGVLTGVCVIVLSSRAAHEHEKRNRQRLIAAAPPLVDLFAAALAAGLLPADAAGVVAAAFGGDDDEKDQHEAPGPVDPAREIATRFAAVARALREGADPEAAWRLLCVDAATATVAAAALRASRTGAPAGETVVKAARDTWHAAEQAAQARIRAVAVRATAPLALCFLPAFVLVGVVPTALGLLNELRP